MRVCVWGGEREGAQGEEGGKRERGQGEEGGVVLCPDHTSHKENGLVNKSNFLGLNPTKECIIIA